MVVTFSGFTAGAVPQPVTIVFDLRPCDVHYDPDQNPEVAVVFTRVHALPASA